MITEVPGTTYEDYLNDLYEVGEIYFDKVFGRLVQFERISNYCGAPCSTSQNGFRCNGTAVRRISFDGEQPTIKCSLVEDIKYHKNRYRAAEYSNTKW